MKKSKKKKSSKPLSLEEKLIGLSIILDDKPLVIKLIVEDHKLYFSSASIKYRADIDLFDDEDGSFELFKGDALSQKKVILNPAEYIQ